MNKVILIGRLVKDCELKFIAGSGMAVVNFRLAVARNFKQVEGSPKADYFPIIIFGKLGESLSKYLMKGKQIAVFGRMQTRGYDKDGVGKKTYVTEVVANEVRLLGNKGDVEVKEGHGNNYNSNGFNPYGGFTEVTGEDDGDIPF